MGHRGYFGIGIFSTKTEINMSNLCRSALAFGADFIYTVEARYKHRKSDTCKAPRHIPLYHYRDCGDFLYHLPKDCELISIERIDGVTLKSRTLKNYVHPERACYLLGAEDFGVPTVLLEQSKTIIHIDTKVCLNVATAGSIVMYDRSMKR